MTLLEIASYACTKINQTDTNDLVAAKNFAKQQFKLIWQSQLWKDSLIGFTKTLGAAPYAVTDNWLPTKQILICPALISHVIAVRNADRKFGVQSQEFFYCKDFDDFQNTGTAVDYMLLSACVWELDTAQALYRRIFNATDAGLTPNVDVFDPSTSILSRATGTTLGNVDRIDGFTKATSTARVSIGPSMTFVNNFQNGNHDPSAVWVNGNTDASVIVPIGQSTQLDVNWGDTISFTPGDTAVVSNVVGDATITSPFGTLTLNATDPNSVVAPSTRSFVAGTEIVSLGPTDTTATKRQRLQLIGKVEANMVLRVLGKRTCPTFTADTDEPGLTGVDNVLMALVHGDMLERERRYGQAQLIFNKAKEMGAALIAEQTVQQAHQKRIIPSDGFGNPYGYDGLLGTKSNPL